MSPAGVATPMLSYADSDEGVGRGLQQALLPTEGKIARERERVAILAQVSTPCTWGSARLLVPGGRGGALLWAVPRRSCPCLDPVALESPAVAIALKRPLLVPTSGGAILVKGEFADLSPRARPDYCKDFAEQASVRKGTHNITNGPLDIVTELTRKYHGAGRGTRRPQCS